MRKLFILFFFTFICFFPVFGKTVYITVVTSDNQKIQLQRDDEDKYFGLFTSDTNELNGKYVSTIEGLEQLKKVEEVEMYGVRGIKDFSLLNNFPYLKYLHLSGCTVFSLSFLSNLENLEILELNIEPMNKYKFQNERIDLSKLKKLKKICYRDGLGEIPNFINIQSFPEIDLSNNNIYSISEDKLLLLNQYSKVDLSFNPIKEKKEDN